MAVPAPASDWIERDFWDRLEFVFSFAEHRQAPAKTSIFLIRQWEVSQAESPVGPAAQLLSTNGRIYTPASSLKQTDRRSGIQIQGKRKTFPLNITARSRARYRFQQNGFFSLTSVLRYLFKFIYQPKCTFHRTLLLQLEDFLHWLHLDPQTETWLPAAAYWTPWRCSSGYLWLGSCLLCSAGVGNKKKSTFDYNGNKEKLSPFTLKSTDSKICKWIKFYHPDSPLGAVKFRGVMKHTWVCPAISMPASRNSSKSWLNFPEAAASWRLVPREEWTTSPAEWLSSAAVWFRSVWASWNDLLQGGSFKSRTQNRNRELS